MALGAQVSSARQIAFSACIDFEFSTFKIRVLHKLCSQRVKLNQTITWCINYCINYTINRYLIKMWENLRFWNVVNLNFMFFLFFSRTLKSWREWWWVVGVFGIQAASACPAAFTHLEIWWNVQFASNCRLSSRLHLCCNTAIAKIHQLNYWSVWSN